MAELDSWLIFLKTVMWVLVRAWPFSRLCGNPVLDFLGPALHWSEHGIFSFPFSKRLCHWGGERWLLIKLFVRSCFRRLSNGPSFRRGPGRESSHHMTTLPSHCTNLTIYKDDKGYGMKVSGDNPVYVQSVKEGNYLKFCISSDLWFILKASDRISSLLVEVVPSQSFEAFRLSHGTTIWQGISCMPLECVDHSKNLWRIENFHFRPQNLIQCPCN